MKGHWVMRCPNCKKWRTKEIRNAKISNLTLNCFSCGKTTKVKKKREFGLSIEARGPYTAHTCAVAIQKLNETQNSQDIRYDGFATYSAKK